MKFSSHSKLLPVVADCSANFGRSIIVFFVGGIIAGFAYAYSSAMLALMLSGAFKLIAALVVLIVPGKAAKEELPS